MFGRIRELFLNFKEKKRAKMLFSRKEELHNLPKNKSIIIFSNDCVGGRLMKDYMLPELTPMVNTWYKYDDFIKMCADPVKYFAQNVENCGLDSNGDFLGRVLDVELHFTHVNDFETAKRKWEAGCKRFFKAIKTPHEIVVVCNDRNFFNEDRISDFLHLEYTQKIMFCHKQFTNDSSLFYMKKEDKLPYVDIMTKFESLFSFKRRYDRFDFYGLFKDIYSERGSNDE